jgi:Toprim domain
MLDITASNVHGIQLVKLLPDGSDKIAVEPKKTHGQCVGWPIVLAPPNDLLALVIAEGVEDALTAHAATGRGAWASGGAGRLPALADKVPSYIEHVAVMADDDKVGRDGANKLGSLLQRRRIDVDLLLTPQKQELAA